MSFFPADFDPREPVVAILDMVQVETESDGPARFIIGTDGVFTDSTGNDWYGSQLLGVSSMGSILNGQAKSGQITLSYFQDPDADDLVAQIKAQGASYIKGQAIKFFVQPIRTFSEFYAPTTAPLQWCQRVCRTVTFSAEGAQGRKISVGFEGWAENRRVARRVAYNTEGHAELIGEANPSLSYIPTSNFEQEKLFG